MHEKPRILLADDEETFRESTADLLRREGYDCLTAADAAGAMRELEKAHFDLLVSDIKMPGNLELELLAKLPSLLSHLPVILVTGHPTLGTAIASVQLNVVAYLVKPIDFQELKEKVDQAVRSSRLHQAVHSMGARLEGWRKDLARVDSTLQGPIASAAGSATRSFIDLTFRNILGSLADLRSMIQVARGEEPSPESLRSLTSARLEAFSRALRRTISVLEKTRRSFKSKELAALRRELEELMGEEV